MTVIELSYLPEALAELIEKEVDIYNKKFFFLRNEQPDKALEVIENLSTMSKELRIRLYQQILEKAVKKTILNNIEMGKAK